MRLALHSALLAAALCGSGNLYAKTELLTTRPGSVVHWSHAVVTVGVDPGAPSRTVGSDDVARALVQATQAWNNVSAEQPRLVPAVGIRPDVVVRFCSGRWDGETIDLGKSRFIASLQDGTVTGALVEINECDHKFAAADQPTGSRYDLQAVLTHELGHVLGLGHSDNRAAMMFPSGGGSTVRAPHVEDQTSLALIYFGRRRLAGAKPTDAESGAPKALATVDAPLQSDAAAAKASTRKMARGRARVPLPEGVVSLLSLKTAGGQDVMVYTCEPTLLPPIGAAPAGSEQHPSGSRAKGSRR